MSEQEKEPWLHLRRYPWESRKMYALVWIGTGAAAIAIIGSVVEIVLTLTK